MRSTPLLAITSRKNEAEHSRIVAIVRLLVKAGANVNASDSNGDTALHHCVRMKYWVSGPSGLAAERARGIPPDEPLRHLIDHGADVALQNNNGQRASDLASQPKEKMLLLAAERAQLEASRGQFKRPRLEDLRPPAEIATEAAAAAAAAGQQDEEEDDHSGSDEEDD
jgi:ankyrin repeat protein